jgi:hypothetical protein
VIGSRSEPGRHPPTWSASFSDLLQRNNSLVLPTPRKPSGAVPTQDDRARIYRRY